MSVVKKYNKTSKKIKVTFRVEEKAAQDAESIFLQLRMQKAFSYYANTMVGILLSLPSRKKAILR